VYQIKLETHTIGGHDYRIRSLLDRNQFHDPLGAAARVGVSDAQWSFFGVVWASGLALAEFSSHHPLEGKRALEIGCGLALSGLVCHARGADVTASDRHPLTAEFLRENLALNALPPMPYLDVDWTAPPAALGRFDLVLASDVMYEPGHPEELARFFEHHLNPGGEVIVVDPGRGGVGRLRRALALLGLHPDEVAPTNRVVRYRA
jgi:predicted nicotinamide N-methyase